MMTSDASVAIAGSREQEELEGDGYSSQELFGGQRRRDRSSYYSYTYDDIILLPGHIDVHATDEVSLRSNVTKTISVKIPLLSSPMDTVTEHEMAIGMALQGALGVIHYNMTVEEQAHEVRLVKKYKNGFISNPACLSPDHQIADVDKLKERYGYSGIPITIDGAIGSTLVGIVCRRDIDYVEDRSTKLKEVMTIGVTTGTTTPAVVIHLGIHPIQSHLIAYDMTTPQY